MKILVTGAGTSGSYQIRGVQLGAAIGATVQAQASEQLIRAHDLVIVVKRPPADLVQRIHRVGVPLVWDVVDAWPQPDGNRWGRVACMAWLRQQIASIRPAAIVAATVSMADDIRSVSHIPVQCIWHHARPGLSRNPIREHVRTVGYEGGNYLGRWHDVLQRECVKRGWRFVVNPPEGLASLDIVVALREVEGYAAKHWKSNVKLANAQGSGTPFIGGRESGYTATSSGEERFVCGESELVAALDTLTLRATRIRAAAGLFGSHPRLDIVATRYAQWLHECARVAV